MNAFIQIDGIPGESQDDQHKDWLEPMSFSFAVSQQRGGSRTDAGTATRGRADFADFQFVKRIDKTTPKLFLECTKGSNVKKVVLQIHRATGKRELYYQVEMQNVLITNVSPSGTTQGEELPLESVSMNYGQIKFKYVHYDKDTKKGEFKSAWDVEKDKEMAAT